MTDSKTDKTLSQALLQAQQNAQALEKDAKNEFHRYRYVASDTMIAEARRVLGDAGLTLAAVGWRLNEAADRVTIRLEIAHAQSGANSGYECEVPVVVEKGRPPDKALFGALTEGLAYFCRGLLLIPRVDGDTDNTPSARDDRNYTPARKPAPVAKPRSTAKDELSELLANGTVKFENIREWFGFDTVGAWLKADRTRTLEAALDLVKTRLEETKGETDNG
jgi:hypothetical protein